MKTARQKALTRRNIAHALFTFTGLVVLLKLSGMMPLDLSNAPSLSAAYGMKLAYYVWPAVPFVIGYFFWASSKEKLLEAEYEEQAVREQEQSSLGDGGS